MASSSDRTESPGRALSSDDAARLHVFAERLFARESPERVQRVTAEHRAELINSAFEFFSIRAEPIAVRVLAGLPDGITVVETAMEDRPFIIDTLLEYFRHLDAPVAMITHPMYRVARDEEGRIVSLEQASASERPESFVHIELELPSTPEDRERIAGEVRAVLVDVRDATGDFDRMTARALHICEETAAQRELIEVRDFLRWLVRGGFVFLGYCRYGVSGSDGATRFATEFGSELGIIRDHEHARFRSSWSMNELSGERRKLLFESPVVISKSRVESQVHRRSPMDSIAIRRDGPNGRVAAFDYFVGLFTSKAYAEEAEHTPILRAKLREVIAAEDAAVGSHDYKELLAAFNSFPKDELFRASLPELLDQLHLVLDLKNESEVRLKVIPDLQRGNVIALVVMPREAFSAQVHNAIKEALAESLNGTPVYDYLALDQGYTARLHFCFHAEPPKPAVVRELEAKIVRLAQGWEDRLEEQLLEKFGTKRGRGIAAHWSRAFGADYQAATPPHRAVTDIACIEALPVPIVPSPSNSMMLNQGQLRRVADARLGIPGLSELMPIL